MRRWDTIDPGRRVSKCRPSCRLAELDRRKQRIVFRRQAEAGMRVRKTIAAAAFLGVVAVGGCRMESDKHGDSDNLKIATPFGRVQVKTNDAAVLEGTGLPAYPGAELVKKKDKNDGAADVNLSFGRFQLRVKAVSYRSTDDSDKVTAFYRKALERYGDVIQCQKGKAVGTPVRTAEGLTCDNDKDNHIAVDEEMSGKLQLKAGSKLHQHIIEIDPDGSGTKFALVALDLPGHITTTEDGNDEKR
jgi:hypothetical protein